MPACMLCGQAQAQDGAGHSPLGDVGRRIIPAASAMNSRVVMRHESRRASARNMKRHRCDDADGPYIMIMARHTLQTPTGAHSRCQTHRKRVPSSREALAPSASSS